MVRSQTLIGYRDDRKGVGKGALVREILTPVWSWAGMGRILGAHEEAWLQGTWLPSVAVSFESSDDVAMTGENGTAWRTYPEVEMELYPNGHNWNRQLVLSVDWKYWLKFADTGAFSQTKDNATYFKASATGYFNKDKNFGMSLDYVNGEDPLSGLPDQEFVLLALNVKF